MRAASENRLSRTTLGGLSGAMLMASLASTGALAQDEERIGRIDEVIVTAQKREEREQEVPIAMRAMDAEQLETIGVTSLGDLRAVEPSLDLRPFATATQSITPFIRGIGNGFVDVFQDPSVAMHINGVYIARMNGIDFDLADLERIEVLKGPQGSLYGRNATGGAINVVTRRPHDEFALSQHLSGGNLNTFTAKTSINAPVTENLFAKASYVHSSSEGFIGNAGEGGDNFGDRNNNSWRFDLRWAPIDTLTVDYGFDYSRLKYIGTPMQSTAAADPGNPGAALVNHEPGLRGNMDPGTRMPYNDITSTGHAITIEWQGPVVTLRSITAYREVEDELFNNVVADGNGFRLDKGPTEVGGQQFPEAFEVTDQSQFSQELQLLGSIGEDFGYVFGLYHFRETADNGFPLSHQLTDPELAAGTPVIVLTERASRADNRSNAVFGELSWTPAALDRRLDLILGARFSYDERDARLSRVEQVWAPFFSPQAPVGVETIDGSGSETFSEFTPSFTARYRWTDDVMTYLRIAQGYKSGGFNTRAPTQEAFASGFGPETVTAFELGIKADWFDRRLRTNAAAFYYDYEDMQLTVGTDPTDPSIFDLLNAGESSLAGFELEGLAMLTANLSLGANYTFLDTDLDEVVDDAGVDVTADFTFANVATHNFSVFADFIVPGVEFGELGLNVRYDFVDDMEQSFLKQQAREGAAIDSFGLLNARVRLSQVRLPGVAGTLDFALWGRNLTDKEYERVATGELPHSRRAVLWGETRSYGINLAYRY